MKIDNTIKKYSYAGLFMVSMATLMFEILLTRILSATIGYHFAFLIVSVAMFGLTIGGICVYLFPRYLTQNYLRRSIVLSALGFSLLIVLTALVYLFLLPIVNKSSCLPALMAGIYLVTCGPFIFSGICICATLTKFSGQISKLYAANFLGSAIGCILLIITLNIYGGYATAGVAALLASIGAFFFALDGPSKKLKYAATTLTSLLGVLLVFYTFFATNDFSSFRSVRNKWRGKNVLYEKWNSYSLIRVKGRPEIPVYPESRALSSAYQINQKVRVLDMDIDAMAGTRLYAFKDDERSLDFLKYHITNIAHYLRPDASVMVIGVGGGKDILSALVFSQKSVLGIEMNKDILNALNVEFGDFTGHLDKNHKVNFVNDEARSYIARINDRFDIIQLSLTDTWAATAAGAFVLSENLLYTVEAWKTFLQHLTPNGILTLSRWYFEDSPGEAYRLVSLASTSLLQLGVKNPQAHIALVKNLYDGARFGMGTIIVSREPFSSQDLNILEKVSRDMKFDIVLSPRYCADSIFADIVSGERIKTVAERLPINIIAPTDDSPFFFNMLQLKNVFNRRAYEQGLNNFNIKAVSMLGVLLIVVVLLTALCILVPLMLTARKEALRGSLPIFLFFGSIGLGFMFIEISQMQRLILFLGHPVYSLSVVLFTLLLSGGLGSYLTARINDLNLKASAIRLLFVLLFGLIIFEIFTRYVLNTYQAATTPVRLILTVIILFPLGLFMGMPFPLGVKLVSRKREVLMPWLWGINGSASVCASVFAVAIALSWSISTAFWAGFLCYLIAFFAFIWASRVFSKSSAA